MTQINVIIYFYFEAETDHLHSKSVTTVLWFALMSDSPGTDQTLFFDK